MICQGCDHETGYHVKGRCHRIVDNENLVRDVSIYFGVSLISAARMISGEARTHAAVRRHVSAFIRKNSATLCGCRHGE